MGQLKKVNSFKERIGTRITNRRDSNFESLLFVLEDI